MTLNNQTRSYLSIFGFGIFLIIPGLDVILKYFGLIGIAGYLLLSFLALFIGFKLTLPTFLSKLTEKQANILAVLTFTVVIVVVAIMYPLANNGTFGPGSDANDALILGATELLQGHYPFYARTYLGNPIAPMPGSVIMAIPFVLIDLFELQNIFWLAVFFGVVRSYLKSSVYALALLWLILAFSPSSLQNLVTGTDHISNTVYVLTAIWLMIKMIPRPDTAEWKKLLPTVFLGVGLSSRSNFIFLLPLLFSFLVQNAGWKATVKYVGIAGAVCALVTIPFWVYDPAGFTPLLVQANKVTQFESILPHAGIIVPGSLLLLSLLLAPVKMTLDGAVFFRNCAIVQLFSVFIMTAISSAYYGRLDLFFGHIGYGLFFLYFGIFAYWIDLRGRETVLANS